jgi:hypothetical protein
MRKLLLIFLVAGLLSTPLFAQQKTPQNAQNTVRVGPFVDSTDGVSLETGITVTGFTVNVFKPGKAYEVPTIAVCTKATRVLTSDGTNFANNEYETIGTVADGVVGTPVVYTWKTTLTGAAYEVKIGASAAVSLDNLKCAVNNTGCGGIGVDWGTGTVAHPNVIATTNTDTQQTIEAIIPGTQAHLITTVDNSAHAAFGGAVMAGANDDCMLHESSAIYWLALPTTRSDTLGTMRIVFSVAGVAPHWENCEVLTRDAFNLFVNGTIGSAVDVRTEMDANSTKLANLDEPTSQVVTDVWATATTAGQVTAGSMGKMLVDNVDVVLSTRSAWTDLTAGFTLAGSVGKHIVDNIDSSISSRISNAALGEPTGLLSDTPTPREWMAWQKMMQANKVTVTNVLKTYFNGTGTPVAKSILTDDTVTFTQAKPIVP